ncbi:uncharacterized protein LOC110747090 isoform X2 [Prunus avium]|uniref:Uncharacterized protein LOC110747090 isoform X2 n=1 Tax=Prunus avium TaxID=42229 RepID=A0A6P5RPL3_PRUAV|nr:uncharacterized protein LOC110747090 isoform X2 [Prunus avium]
MASLSQSASLFVSFFFSFDTKKECEMLDYYEQLAASPYNDSLKVLEADIQHANMLLNCLLLNVMQLLEANCFEGEGCVTVPKWLPLFRIVLASYPLEVGSLKMQRRWLKKMLVFLSRRFFL